MNIDELYGRYWQAEMDSRQHFADFYGHPIRLKDVEKFAWVAFAKIKPEERYKFVGSTYAFLLDKDIFELRSKISPVHGKAVWFCKVEGVHLTNEFLAYMDILEERGIKPPFGEYVEE